VCKRLALTALLATLILLPLPAHGQQSASEEIKQLKSEIQALKANQAELQRQIQELQKLVSPRTATTTPPARDIFVSTEGAASKGDAKAPITLIEYSDYQCPFCSRAFLQIAPQLERDYITTGKLKYVFIDLPIEAAHPLALTASIAARCAGEQGKYWDMHDRLLTNQNSLQPGDMVLHAEAIKLDMPRFRQCFDTRKYEKEIREKAFEARMAGVNGTPTFYFGLTSPNDSKVKIITGLNGAKAYETFKAVIDNLLVTQASQGQ